MKIRQHYRHLPNGQLVHVHEYFDKRKAAQASPERFKGQVVHADEKSTSVMGQGGKLQTFKHQSELSQKQVHAQLNRPLPVNADLAHEVARHKLGIKDHDRFLADATEEEGLKSQPRFKDAAGAKEWFHEEFVKPKLKELRAAHGKTTTPAKAYLSKHPDYREMHEEHAAAKDAPAHSQGLGRALAEHAEEAHAEAELAHEQSAKALAKGPEAVPKVSGLSPSVKLLPVQAHALAQLHGLERAVLDLDAGGGKGLILPADALALMTAGKVRRPLIVVPTPTLDQNAGKITDEYSQGGVNVFKISNDTIDQHYGGDAAKMVEDIKRAPANTIFMATYDAVAHQDLKGGERFGRAKALGSAGFDYVACDEAHNVKNEDSARFQALSHLMSAKYRRMASGTFLANDPRDVAGPLKLLYPHMDLDAKKLEKFYGKSETAEGATWSREGLKKLRGDLQDLGLVSFRRENWLNDLPKRTDKLRVVSMGDRPRKVYEAVLQDAIGQLESEAQKDPLLRRAIEQDDALDPNHELPPALMSRLEVLQGISDYPDEMAAMLESQLRLLAGAPREAPREGEEGLPEDELADVRASLGKFSAGAKNALLSLKGEISPKAQDFYKAAKAHLAKAGNGKIILFCQRKASARHVLKHMPEDLSKKAMYFDASKLGELDTFTGSTDGPQILVAVDASIKEGVNMQAANMLYRYDHHLTPGNQEQSLARTWRFGQTRPCDMHFGIVDGSADVCRYARLCSKASTNMQVVSDFESSKDAPIYKLSLANLKDKRDAAILPDYQALNDEIMVHQKGKAKEAAKRYGDKRYSPGGGELPGAKPQHGEGAFHGKKKDDLEKALARRLPTDLVATPAVGAKITSIDDSHRAAAARIVVDGIDKKESAEQVARRLRISSGRRGGEPRDWLRVAKTEMTDAKARSALDFIILTQGGSALVVRSTQNCCEQCARAFGRLLKRRWRADYIPEKFKGAVHPNCVCGPWEPAKRGGRKQLRKALVAARGYPMGLVRRQPGGDGKPEFALSTGMGAWVPLDSITGRSVMRAVLGRTPLVRVGSAPNGDGHARIGHGRSVDGKYVLYDARGAGARYFDFRPGEGAAKTYDDWMEHMLKVMPVVCAFPEPWEGRAIAAMLPLTAFMGYRQFTDWWAVIPAYAAKQPLASLPAGAGSARELVRRWNKQLLDKDTLAK